MVKEKIAIIGSGIGGLSLAYYIQKEHPEISIEMFEREQNIGGLAVPFEIQGSKLEKFYHHIFTTDKYIIQYIKDLGLEDKLHWYKDKRATFYDGALYPFLTPMDLLKFKPLPVVSRLRIAATSAYLSFTKSWKGLEKYTADNWLRRYVGQKGYDIFWKPLLYGKFQERHKDITMSWIWSRINVRLNSGGKLGYMTGSFGQLFDRSAEEIKKKGGNIHTGVSVSSVERDEKKKRVRITYTNRDGKVNEKLFDRVVITTPSKIYTNFLKGLSKKYIERVNKVDYISAQTIILTLNKPLTEYYWTSVVDVKEPTLVLIEQSNLLSKKAYNGKYVVYLGNYLQNDSPVLKMSDEELKKIYYPFLKRINNKFKDSWVEEFRVFRAPFAQPIVDIDYHNHLPEFKSNIKGVYILNMSQVYPEDRGMNFAIKNAFELKELMF